jgi:hypothetical protein
MGFVSIFGGRPCKENVIELKLKSAGIFKMMLLDPRCAGRLRGPLDRKPQRVEPDDIRAISTRDGTTQYMHEAHSEVAKRSLLMRYTAREPNTSSDTLPGHSLINLTGEGTSTQEGSPKANTFHKCQRTEKTQKRRRQYQHSADAGALGIGRAGEQK